MDKVKLANLIVDKIKDEVDVLEVAGTKVMFKVRGKVFNPSISIMEETKDGPRLRFEILVNDVTEVIKKDE